MRIPGTLRLLILTPLRALLCVGRRDTTLGLMSWCLLALTGAVRAILPPHVHLGPTIRRASKALAVELAPCKERPSPQPGLCEQGHTALMILADYCCSNSVYRVDGAAHVAPGVVFCLTNTP